MTALVTTNPVNRRTSALAVFLDMDNDAFDQTAAHQGKWRDGR
jgi:hypothetical protein